MTLSPIFHILSPARQRGGLSPETQGLSPDAAATANGKLLTANGQPLTSPVSRKRWAVSGEKALALALAGEPRSFWHLAF